jgi:L-ascorbate metabolism protein UlaG (beta-lactamase superfamily)
MEIRFLGHACFELRDGETNVLIDPFLTGNPKAAVSADDVNPTHILLTHGHADHLGDTVAIAKRTGAQVVAIVELANELGEEGLDNVHDPNIGGTVKFDWGWVKLTPAWHTAVSPNGTAHAPAGLLIGIGGKVVYHLGDTGLFSDLRLVAHRGDPIDIALMCIGGHYTMDRLDAVVATEFIEPRVVIPCHYNTMPVLETDAQAFKADVEKLTSIEAGAPEVVILEPGESHTA